MLDTRNSLEHILIQTNTFSSSDKDKLIHLIPELKPMVGCAQNHPAHIYDVFEHTITVVENVECDLVLKIIALLHDSGKPFAKTIGEDGFDHFRGHEAKSAEISKVALSRLGYVEKFIERICLIIKYHDRPTKPTSQNIAETAALIGSENLSYLFQFQIADMKGHEKRYGQRKIEVLKEVVEMSGSIGL